MNRPILLPREHGAWGILLQPFVAAAILARQWTWLLIPALIAILTVFIAREPLLILARQRFIWKEPHPESALALRNLQVEAAILLVCGLCLLSAVALVPLAILGAVALSLTATAIYMTLRNKQRSVMLQIVSAFGLGSSALLAGFVATGQIFDQRTWLLWAILSLHFLIGIFVVHTRLDRRAHKPDARLMLILACAFLVVSIVAAGGALFCGRQSLVFPLLLSAGVSAAELIWLHQPQALKEPLKRVGYRALAGSILHTVVSVVALW